MNTNKLKTEHLILIMILMMALINGLMSCSTGSKIVYEIKDGWKPHPIKSSVTGWTYTSGRGEAQH